MAGKAGAGIRLAVVNAIGLGSRLPQGPRQPKALVAVGRPREAVISRQIRELHGAGVTHVVVLAGHLKEQIHEYFEGKKFPVRVTVLDVESSRGTADPLNHAALKELVLSKRIGHFLYVNCDVVGLESRDFRQLARAHLRRKKALTVAAVRVPKERQKQFGMMKMEKDRIVSFREKPGRPISGARANAGVYAFSIKALGHGFHGMDQLIRELARGRQAVAWHHEGEWHDIGTPEGLERAEKYLEARARRH